MEDSDGPKTRRYGLRSRGNINNNKPGPAGDKTVRGTGAETGSVLRDQTSQVCNAPKVEKCRRNTRKTRASVRKGVDIAPEIKEDADSVGDNTENKAESLSPVKENEIQPLLEIEENSSTTTSSVRNTRKTRAALKKAVKVASEIQEDIASVGGNPEDEKETLSTNKANNDEGDNLPVQGKEETTAVTVDENAKDEPELQSSNNELEVVKDVVVESTSNSASNPSLNLDQEKDKDKCPTKKEEDSTESNGKKKADPKKSFFDLPVEEQILIVRKKLEKIIHKKETNQNKALDLLRILERTKFTSKLLEDSKIDLTLEALKFVIKDENITKKTDNVLRSLKKLKKKKEELIVDKKWREKERKDAVKTTSAQNSTLHWMDKLMEDNSKKMEKLNKKLDSLKSGVKEIQPSEKMKEKSPDQNSNSDIDTITDSIVQLKIKGKEDAKKDKVQPLKSRKEIKEISETVENLSLKETESSKLFTKPKKVHTTHPKKQETIVEDPDSLIARLKKLELENKIHKIKIKLDGYTAKDDKVQTYQLLKDLNESNLTLELLETTKIGLSLNSFRKRVEDQEMARFGKEIIRKWKSLVPEPRKDPSTKVEEETAEEREKRQAENTGKIRDHFRQLLVSALTEEAGVSNTVTESLAAGVEEAIFERFKTTSQKYRSQVQSRQYNLRNNRTLRENLLTGNISPDEIAVMSHEDMANEDLKKMREDLMLAGFDCLPASHAEGDKFCTCRICLPPWIKN